MNWKDLISQKISRKARIVLIGIAALVYVYSQICSAAAEGKTVEPELALWTIGGIIGISIVGIAAQWSIEFFEKKQQPAAEPEKEQGGE
jgi:hypothetical protein